jgi:hypothetical protein
MEDHEYYLIWDFGEKSEINAIRDEASLQHILDTLADDPEMRALMIYYQKSWVELVDRLESLVNEGYLKRIVNDRIAEVEEKRQDAGIKKFAELLRNRFPKEYDSVKIDWKSKEKIKKMCVRRGATQRNGRHR